jgi:DNA-binding CsgD family transcriptional regulator
MGYVPIFLAMHELTTHDYQAGWRLVCGLTEAASDAVSFARQGTLELPQLVASEITTLSVCDLARHTRSVVSNPEGAISAREREGFDHFFDEHPLVRYHADRAGADAHRITDSMPQSTFRESALYNEYYKRIGIDYVIAVPLFVDRGLLVSFVLNRNRLDFSDRERALLDLVKVPLGALYRNLLVRGRGARGFATLPVTPREREVLSWLAAGKTDKDIGQILAMSPRTVQKHLQHIYEKLGVETRTAAVVRAMEIGSGSKPG